MIKANLKPKNLSLNQLFPLILLLFAFNFSFSQTSVQNGNWNTGTTWDTGIVPAAADNVTIASGHTVTVSNAVDFNTLQVSSGGILQLNNNSVLSNIITNDGTLNIQSNVTFDADITNNGTLNWYGGNISSTSNSTLTNTGVFNIYPNNLTFGIDVINANGGNINRENNFNINFTETFTNQVGGTVTLNGGGLSLTGTLVNAGDFGGGGGVTLNGANAIFNGGNFGDGTGTLQFFNAISISGSVDFTPSFSNVIHNNDTVVTATSTSMVIPSGTTYTMNTNTQLVDFSLVTNNGTLNLNSTITFDNDVTNNGTLNWNNGNISSTTNSTLTNTGVFNIYPNNLTFGIDVINANGGNINKETNFSVTFTESFTNQVGGTVTLNGGGLNLTGTLVNAGDFGGSATVRLSGANAIFNGGNFGDGTGTLQLLNAISITGTVDFTPGFATVNHNNDTVVTATSTSMVIPSGTTYNMNTNTQLVDFSLVTNNGTLNLNNTITFNNDVTNNGTLNWNSGNISSTVNSTLTNTGTFNIYGSNTTFGFDVINANGGNINKENNFNVFFSESFTNQVGGTVTVNEGTLSLTGTLINAGDFGGDANLNLIGTNVIFNGGSFGNNTDTGALQLFNAISITGAVDFTPSFATVNHNNDSVLTATTTSMVIPSGTTYNMNTNAQLVDFGSITNNGTLNLNSTITFDNDVTNNGTLNWNNGNISSTVNSTLTNTGTFNIYGNNTTFGFDVINASGGSINKENSFVINFPETFTNQIGGTVTVNEGTLFLTGTLVNAGDFGGSATLSLNGANATFNSGSFGDGNGALQLFNAISITGAVDFTPSFATVNHNNDSVLTATTTSMVIPSGTTYNMNTNAQLVDFGSITNNGTLNLNSTITFDNDVTNNGTLNWNNGNISSTVNSTLTNTGTFNIYGNNTTFGFDVINANGGNINKENSFVINFPETFTNQIGGTVTVNEGTLFLTGTLVNAGDFGGDANVTLNGTNATFNGGNFGDNTGTSTLNIFNAISISGTAAFTPSFATVNHNNNTVITATSTSMVISSGTTYIMNFNSQLIDFDLVTNNGTLIINGNSTFENDITNNEILNWNNGAIISAANSTLTNHGTANFNTINIGTFQLDVINESTGVIVKGGANGNQTIATDFTNKVGGTVNILASKSLNFESGSLTNSGTINITGVLQLNNESATFNTGSSISGTGFLTVIGVNTVTGTANFTPGVATVNHINGSITATGTSMQIPNGTIYNMGNGSQLVDFGLVTNDGTLNINGNSTFENDITNNEILNWNNGAITSVANSTLTNFGTANFNATNIGTFQLDVINESTGIIVKGGANGNQTIATDFTNKVGGTVNILASKSLNLAGNSINNGTINNSGSFFINGNMSGEGNFIGNITNGATGTLQPGPSPSGFGCFTFDNNTNTYTNQGTYKVEINNTTPCSGYDQIVLTGTANLGGTLDVTLNYASPANFDKVTIIDAATISGTFATVNALPTGWTLKYNYPNTGEVTLEYYIDLAPVIQCPANISVNNDTGDCGAIVTFAATETTAIPASTITYSIDPGSSFNVGTTTVTATATNTVGTDSCTFTITVIDNEDPEISCPSNVNATATSATGAVVDYTAPVGTDNCSASTLLTAGLTSGSTFPIGQTTVTYQVTDAANVTADCSFTVTVNGVTPVIQCPGNISVNNDAGDCGAIVTFAATETTAIPASTITYSIDPGSSFAVGITTVTATATNAVGTDSCTFTITVVDNEAPSITCAANVSVNNYSGQCTAAITVTPPTASDNCIKDGNALNFDGNDDYILVDNPQDFNVGATTDFTIQAKIKTTRTSATIFSKMTPGSPTGYQLWVYNSKFLLEWANGSIIFIDSQTIVNDGDYHHVAAVVSRSTNNIKLYVDGILTADVTNVDFGNDIDNTAAVFIGQERTLTSSFRWLGDLDELAFFKSTRTSAQILASATSSLSVSESNLTGYWKFNSGIANSNNASVINAIDSSGNNHSGTLTNFALNGTSSNWVNGAIPPFTLINSFNGTADASGTYPVGVTTVTWTATDIAGNPVTCDQIITVVDNEDPEISCPSNVNATATSATGAVVDYTAPVGTDNCSASTLLTAGLTSGSTFPIGQTTVTYQVTDAANVTADCSFTVTVNGVAPVIQCPGNITVDNDGAMCDAIVSFAATETTAIPASTITYSINPGSSFSVGTTMVTATATSASGIDTCTFSVTVNATTGPVISFTALANQDVNSSVLNGNGGATPTGGVYSGSGVTDDGDGLTYSFDPGAAGVGTHIITYTLTNANGCSIALATDDVEVTDNTLSVSTFDMEGIKLYPNPMKTKLTIELNNTSNLVNVILFDITGKKVLTSTNKIIFVDTLQSGVYLVKVNTDKGTFIKKLIKD